MDLHLPIEGCTTGERGVHLGVPDKNAIVSPFQSLHAQGLLLL